MPHVATTKPGSAKQEAILRQSVHVFARRGFRGTDVQEIANRAQVGKGTVYRYFGDKQALFWATAYWVLEQLHACLRGAADPADGALNKLSAACHAYAKFFAENPDYLEIFVLDRAEFRGRAPEHHRELHEQMIREFTEIIEQGMASGEVRRGDPRKIVWTLGSTLYGSIVFAAFSTQEQSIIDLAAHATEIFLRGIAAASEQQGTAS